VQQTYKYSVFNFQHGNVPILPIHTAVSFFDNINKNRTVKHGKRVNIVRYIILFTDYMQYLGSSNLVHTFGYIRRLYVIMMSSTEGTVSVDYNCTSLRHVDNWYCTVAPSEIGLIIIYIIVIHSNYTRRNMVPTRISGIVFLPLTCVQSLSSELHACRHRDSVSGPGSQDQKYHMQIIIICYNQRDYCYYDYRLNRYSIPEYGTMTTNNYNWELNRDISIIMSASNGCPDAASWYNVHSMKSMQVTRFIELLHQW